MLLIVWARSRDTAQQLILLPYRTLWLGSGLADEGTRLQEVAVPCRCTPMWEETAAGVSCQCSLEDVDKEKRMDVKKTVHTFLRTASPPTKKPAHLRTRLT